jgi:hypothetical protein
MLSCSLSRTPVVTDAARATFASKSRPSSDAPSVASAPSAPPAQKPGAPGSGPNTYRVDGFSSEYHAEVHVLEVDPDLVGRRGFIVILDRAGREVLHVGSVERPNDLWFVLHDGAIESNAHDLFPGEESVIAFEDFDFDGAKDFAIMDGRNSCYGGPSYRVFLSRKRGFVESKGFTRLAQAEYCGLFQVDRPKRRIHAMTKSGCCWHEYTTFAVVNGDPVAVEIVTESVSPDDQLTITTQRVVNGKWKTTSETKPYTGN